MSERYDYDRTLKPGDYIRAYRAGIHTLVRIERRFADERDVRVGRLVEGEEKNPLFHYVKVLDADLKPTRSPREQCCDACYCKKVTEETLTAELKAHIARYEDAIAYLFEHSTDLG